MKKSKGIINQIKDNPYEPVNTVVTLEQFQQCIDEIQAKRKPGKPVYLTNRLGTFKIVNGFWYVLLTDESYIECESPYDKDFKLKDKVTIA